MVDKQQTIEVYNSFFAVARQLKKLAHQSAANLGLTVHQIGILNSIRTDPGLTQKEVTERLVFAKSRVSLHIDALVEKGLATREASELDRRETKLYVTTDGDQLCLRYNEEAYSHKVLEIALQRYSKEELDSLVAMHKQILAQL
ncbi:MarR family transcriptional regulator [Paenibacillus sp. 19GGS1-52]|uniref:MarR family winged helix-turn-helix transcriptional regulator n=1 Tax=Paenibacillus sp. 19GGS1-52 TaxID=2758563 RepID=UPI001EFA32D4|nr:MarR family transcriptional regulator [Paenibacillus sp. 19GGS1-52]ULO05306.1 MarR family transcriptional regulator [Paenibacillus sp. 19GGS1-52]